VATNLDEFGADLKSGKYDLVIADASDIPAVREQVQSAPSKPLLISPVFAGLKFRETDYTAFVEKALKSRNK
jgi:hypothetical protein